MTADNVLLHSFEVVRLSADGGFVEHLGGFLERSGRHEALRLKGGAGDTLQDLHGRGGHGIAHLDKFEVLAFELRVLVAELACRHDHTGLHRFAVAGIGDNFLAPDAVVLFGKVEFVDDLLFKEAGVARFVNLHFAHHLTDDDLEVLVVDLHTLQAVNVLDLIHDIFLHCRRAFDGKDVGRRDGTVGQRRSGAHVVVFLHEDLFREGHEVMFLFAKFGADDDFTVTALDAAHLDFAVDFGNDGGVARIAGFEELGDAGQTTGDVTGLSDGTRNLDEHFAGVDLLPVFDHDMAVDGEVVRAEKFAVVVKHMARRHA